MSTAKTKTRKHPAPTRPGVYSRGSDTVDAILQAALKVLIEEGAQAFTLRRIASECGLKVGNVSRHFPRKEMLVQVLLEELLSPSEGLVKKGIVDTGMSAESALALIIEGSIQEIQTKKMTHLFTELWAMSNHNDFVAERVEQVYAYTQSLIAIYVAKLNPALSAEEVELVSVYISALIEGTTVVAGYRRHWSHLLPDLASLASRHLVHLAASITPEQVRGLKMQTRSGPEQQAIGEKV